MNGSDLMYFKILFAKNAHNYMVCAHCKTMCIKETVHNIKRQQRHTLTTYIYIMCLS